MKTDVAKLREVVTKLTFLLAGQNVEVTQRGAQAYVRFNKITLLPEVVNIPYIPDNATESFVLAIQGFIDHEIAHVLFTDGKIYVQPGNPKLQNLVNILEDTMIERLVGERFPGAHYNLDKLHQFFIEEITTPAWEKVKGHNANEWAVLTVPAMRALSGQGAFQRFMKDTGAENQVLIRYMLDHLPADFGERLARTRTTAENVELAKILEAIVYPPPVVMPRVDEESTSEPNPDDGKDATSFDTFKTEEAKSKPKSPEPDGEDKGEDSSKGSMPGSAGEGDEDHDGEKGSDDGKGEKADKSKDDGESETSANRDRAKEAAGDDEHGEHDGDRNTAPARAEDESVGDEAEDQAALDADAGAGGAPADDEGLGDDAERADGDPVPGNEGGAAEADDEDDDFGDVEPYLDEGNGGSEPEPLCDPGLRGPADDGDKKPGEEPGESSDDAGNGGAGSSAADGDSGAFDAPSGDAGDADRAAEPKADKPKPKPKPKSKSKSKSKSPPADDTAGKDEGAGEGEGAADGASEEQGLDGEDTEGDPAEGVPGGVGGINPFAGEDPKLDDKTFADAIAEKIGDMARDFMKAADYTVYTRDFDKIAKTEAAPGALKKHADKLAKIDEESRGMIGTMQKEIERMMAARSQVMKVPGFRTGKLHAGSLHRIIQSDDRVFRRKVEARSKDTAVILLIDLSGSMQSRDPSGRTRLHVALQTGMALAQTLERVGLNNEVLGFTTFDPYEVMGSALDEARREIERMRFQPTRISPMRMPILKGFDERLTPPVKLRFLHEEHDMGHHGNPDGEAVQAAALRLLARKETRKVLIVLSDGQPACDGSNPGAEMRHLTMTVKKVIEDYKIETIGIGIQTDAVKRYYPKHVILNDLASLPTTVMGEMKRILLS